MFFGRLVVDANGGVMAGILFLSWARIIQICAGAHQKWRGRPRFSDSLDRDRSRSIAIEEAKVLSIPLTSGFLEIPIPDSPRFPILRFDGIHPHAWAGSPTCWLCSTVQEIAYRPILQYCLVLFFPPPALMILYGNGKIIASGEILIFDLCVGSAIVVARRTLTSISEVLSFGIGAIEGQRE